MPTLHDPIRIGAWNLRNRIIMAPLTRCRANEGRVPNELMAEYYRQRATAGLIITEATSICAMGVGYPDTPGIWSDEQVGGWKLITKAVHDEGGLIILQLWHVGRISDPSYLNGELPVAPSAIAADGHVSLIRPKKAYVTPRAWNWMRFHPSWRLIARALRTRRRRASTAWKFTARMVTCSINFCRTARTSEPMPMVARLKTGHG